MVQVVHVVMGNESSIDKPYSTRTTKFILSVPLADYIPHLVPQPE